MLKLFIVLFLVVSCASPKKQTHTSTGVIENVDWYGDEVETTDEPQLRLDIDNLITYLDVRGMGDSAWTLSRKPQWGEKDARTPDFINALNLYDPKKEIFVGDLSFINFETVVGRRCDKIRMEVSFYFLTDPISVIQSVEHGFNLLSMSNNHAQDCTLGRAFYKESEKKHGPLMTEESMLKITPSKPFLWNGVGEAGKDVTVKEFEIKHEKIKVAMGSISLINWDIPNARVFDFTKPEVEQEILQYLEQFKMVEADLKVLSIHTQDGSAYKKPEAEAFKMLKNVAHKFVEDFDGDLVFGHGPHTWGGVRVIEKKSGKHGIIFTSLGNFIHEGLGTNSDNYIARALYDIKTLRVKQIQVIPYLNNRKLPQPDPNISAEKIPVTYYSQKELVNEKEELGKAVHANFKWRLGSFKDHEKKKRGLFFATFE